MHINFQDRLDCTAKMQMQIKTGLIAQANWQSENFCKFVTFIFG